MEPFLSASTRRLIDSLLAGAPPVDSGFLEVLRANLRAAAQHVAMGHGGESFRECSRPRCRDAAMIIPPLEPVAAGATDAELDEILDRVLAELPATARKHRALQAT